MNIDKLSSHILHLLENANPEATDLFLKNQALAYNLANRAAGIYKERAGGTLGGADVEDFAQEALMALYRAAEAYDPSSGLAFSTLATTAVTNAIRSLVKTGLRKKRAIVSTDLDTPVTGPDGEEGELTRLDTIGDPSAQGLEDRSDSMEVLRSAIDQVTAGNARDRKVLTDLMTLGNEFDFRTAGKEIGLSQTMIQNIINKYTPRLKKLLNNKGIGGYDDRGTMVPSEQTRPGEYTARQKKGSFKGNVELMAQESIAIGRLLGLFEKFGR